MNRKKIKMNEFIPFAAAVVLFLISVLPIFEKYFFYPFSKIRISWLTRFTMFLMIHSIAYFEWPWILAGFYYCIFSILSDQYEGSQKKQVSHKIKIALTFATTVILSIIPILNKDYLSIESETIYIYSLIGMSIFLILFENLFYLLSNKMPKLMTGIIVFLLFVFACALVMFVQLIGSIIC